MKKPDERGVSAVEFALLLPVLVLIIFFILEGGLILYNQAVITNASREGARSGILSAETRPTLSDIQTVVTKYTNGRLISFASGTVNPTVTLGSDGACVAFGNPANGLRVNVSYQYTFLVLDNFGFTGPLLQANTVMKCE